MKSWLKGSLRVASRICATLGLCTALAGGCQSADPEPLAVPVDGPQRPGTRLPPGLDGTGLDEPGRQQVVSVLAAFPDPCRASARSLLEVLTEPQPCAVARALARTAVRLTRNGLPQKLVARELERKHTRKLRASFMLEGSPYFGDPSSKLVVVEFMDYQCGACVLASGALRQLVELHGAVLYIKHMPLERHRFARPAALASLAAHRQGAFAALHELLVANYRSLSDELIRKLAVEAGLDMERFDRDLADPELKKLLARDLYEADLHRVTGTPTVFLNGVEVPLSKLNRELKKAAEAQ